MPLPTSGTYTLNLLVLGRPYIAFPSGTVDYKMYSLDNAEKLTNIEVTFGEGFVTWNDPSGKTQTLRYNGAASSEVDNGSVALLRNDYSVILSDPLDPIFTNITDIKSLYSSTTGKRTYAFKIGTDTTYIYNQSDEPTDIDVDFTPDVCFLADTMITTADGPIAVQHIKPEDRVVVMRHGVKQLERVI